MRINSTNNVLLFKRYNKRLKKHWYRPSQTTNGILAAMAELKLNKQDRIQLVIIRRSAPSGDNN